MAIQADDALDRVCFLIHDFIRPFDFMQTDENRVRRLHALRYAGRSPCRCFAPVLIREDGELSQTGSTNISRKPTCRLANQQVLKVAQLPSVLQLRPSVSGRPATNLIPSRFRSVRVLIRAWREAVAAAGR